ncbi:maker7 [Drosophila busckii]|uniref:Maker7 n=1 Tax=Drosophila busckii TaxID=30019 RepID=A0A0M4ETE4_DROBS|nr:maker7 [Drosophila busckii]
MCGIFAIFSNDGQPIEGQDLEGSKHSLRELAYRQSGKQRHRGPDSTGVVVLPEHGVAMVHERLRIVGVEMATKIMRERDPSFRLKTFSVGLRNAPDFEFARQVAKYIGSDHTELVFEIDEALDGIRDIVYFLETYDAVPVRCGLPMLLLTRYIKSTGIKMILSGEGADEIFGGYLYFHKAPNYDEFHAELVKRLHMIHLTDCLRANKVAMAKGVELRVPFLDTDFVNYVMSIRPQDKIPGPLNAYKDEQQSRPEKFVLRAAFADNYLPDSILWRQKEQFSAGVGYDWVDNMCRVVSDHVSTEEFEQAAQRFPFHTPTTKEEFYYRCIFEQQFPGESAARIVPKRVLRLDWA